MSAGGGVRGTRLAERLSRFATIGATPGGGVNRQALTPGDREARALLARLAGERGFRVEQDAMANLFVRREGTRPDAAPLLIGSHLDTQPTGGRFDGALGVLAAFEVLEVLEDDDVQTGRPVEVVAWTNEEGCRFSPGAMGSMAFARGAIEPAWQAAVARDDGRPLGDELAATLASLDVPRRALGNPISAYVELHIEQGPLLEEVRVPIGAVLGIQGVRWYEVRIDGKPAHAGTTPLPFRRDALAAAVLAIGILQRELMTADPNLRLTVGQLDVQPGVVNAIPGRVTFSIDLRHPERQRLLDYEGRIEEVIGESAALQGCRHAIRTLQQMEPCRFPVDMVRAVERAAERAGYPSLPLTSGAYHDALFLAAVAPAAMIFVPSQDGLSHNEAEFTGQPDIEAGARVLHGMVVDLAR